MTASQINTNTHLIPVTGEKLYESLRAVYEEEPLEDAHGCARAASRISVIVASALGSVTFIPVSLPLGKLLGPLCAAGNFTTFLVVDYWSAKGMINEAFGPKTQAEIELRKEDPKKDGSTCKKVILISSAFLIALLAQVPNALAAMEYNEKKYKIAAGLVLLVSGSILPLRSLLLSLEHIALKTQDPEDVKVTELKEKMIGLLDSCHEAFIKKDLTGKSTFIQSLPAAAENNADEFILALMQQDDETPSSLTETAFNYAGIGLGVILAGIFEYVSAQYTAVQTKQEVYDNDVVGGVFAALAVASTAYLIGLSIIKTTQRIFNVFGNFIEGKESRNLSWQLRPKLSAALTTIGFLINVTALGPSYVILGDFYTKKVERNLFQNEVCIALFLLFLTSSLDIIDEGVIDSLANGTEEEKEILKVSEAFKKSKGLIQKCSNDEFMAYLNRDGNVPRAIRAKLGGVTQDQSSPLRERSSF